MKYLTSSALPLWVAVCLTLPLPACESEAPPATPSFAEQFTDKQQSLAEPLEHLLANIDKTMAGHFGQRGKADTMPVAESPTTFGFTIRYGNAPKLPPNALLLYRPPLLLSQSPADGAMYGEQGMLYELSAALAGTAKAFEPKANESARLKEFTSMVDRAEAYLENLEYLIMVVELQRTGSTFYGTTCKGGVYEAQLQAYTLGNPEPIVLRKLSAGNSKGVSGKDFEALSKKVSDDFEKNINTAIKEAVKSIGTTRGDIDTIHF